MSIWKFLRLPKLWQLQIMRLFQDQFLVGVTGVIFNKKEEVLLFQYSYRNFLWGLPGGYLKSREHPKEGLEREVEEESGLTVSADARYKIRTDRETARLDIVYVGTFIGGTFQSSQEVTDAKFFRFDALPRIRTHDLLLIEKIYRLRNRVTRE